MTNSTGLDKDATAFHLRNHAALLTRSARQLDRSMVDVEFAELSAELDRAAETMLGVAAYFAPAEPGAPEAPPDHDTREWAKPDSLDALLEPTTMYFTGHSAEDEVFSGGPYADLEIARAAAVIDGLPLVFEARRRGTRLAPTLCFDNWVERLAEDDEGDFVNPHSGEWPALERISEEQWRDLRGAIDAAIDAWQLRHGLRMEPWCVDVVRELPARSETEAAG